MCDRTPSAWSIFEISASGHDSASTSGKHGPSGFLYTPDQDSETGFTVCLEYHIPGTDVVWRDVNVSRYVKRLDAAEEPWFPTSEFTAIDVSLRDWSLSLPASLQLNRTAFYLRKESLQLGALILLQCTYHWTICDLYRISTPQLYRLQIRWQYPREFQDHLQTTMFQRAQDCASILRDALNHGTKILADTWLPSVAFDSNRVMLHYVTRILGLQTEQGKAVLKEIMPHVNSNLDCLEAMQSITSMAGPFVSHRFQSPLVLYCFFNN